MSNIIIQESINSWLNERIQISQYDNSYDLSLNLESVKDFMGEKNYKKIITIADNSFLQSVNRSGENINLNDVKKNIEQYREIFDVLFSAKHPVVSIEIGYHNIPNSSFSTIRTVGYFFFLKPKSVKITEQKIQKSQVANLKDDSKNDFSMNSTIDKRVDTIRLCFKDKVIDKIISKNIKHLEKKYKNSISKTVIGPTNIDFKASTISIPIEYHIGNNIIILITNISYTFKPVKIDIDASGI
jgi:hypothetical protein